VTEGKRQEGKTGRRRVRNGNRKGIGEGKGWERKGRGK